MVNFVEEMTQIFSVDPVFNFTRPITFKHLILSELKKALPNNATFPWKTEDHVLGLRSQVHLDTFDKDFKITYHENFVNDGSSYRFHSPYELPFHETTEYNSQMLAELQFLVTPQISQLDQSLHSYSAER